MPPTDALHGVLAVGGLSIIDTTRERTDMWQLERYGLPWMYWNLMLKGMA